MGERRIEDYALVGDLHTAALVGIDGSVDWLCLPRFDSGACFAALLGDASDGRWRLAPEASWDGGRAVRRSYRDESLVLDTEWELPAGRLRVTDFMAAHRRWGDLVRVVEGLSGSVDVRSELLLRFDDGQVRPWLRPWTAHHGHELGAVAGPDAAWLRTDAPLAEEDGRTVSRFRVAAGQRVTFALSYSPSHLPPPTPLDADDALADTLDYWRDWIAGCTYDGRRRDAVRRSLVLLKALTYAPTGGILAAATTSLPEEPGGVRNWDYRYCWLRDATFTLQALLGTGHVDEAKAWREWLLRAVAGDPADLQIMYGLDGSRRIPERTVDWLPGFDGSAPVRVGNAAAGQFQLDVWGEVLDGLHLARDAGLAPDDAAWDLQRALLDHLEGSWHEPDNGLWEMRGPRRHFVHSKVMAWVAFDRAVDATRRHGLDGPTDHWRGVRDEIHDEVCREGFDADRNTFVQSYGSTEVDASLLLLPRVGFLPAHDPRIVGTVAAVRKDLTHHGFLTRYRPQAADDGLPGSEGAFVACTFWLVDALAATGRREEAEDLFDRLLDLRNDVGMLSEEYDPVHHRQLGNTPQAFSLVGLVNSARALSGTSTSTRAAADEARTPS